MASEFILGIIGGSGLYALEGLQNQESIEVDTPYGKPSSPIMTGEINGKKLAFLARHGIGHILSPSEVPYQANIWALKSLGVSRIVSVSACGSLRADYAPGNIIIPDQIFDFTHKRPRSFFGKGLVVHVGTADPFCPELSAQLTQALQAVDAPVKEGGTYITIEGPRFSTKGESNTFRSWGMSIIGMTASPEVFLAREAEICYSTMAHVTDYDVWHTSEEPVTVEMVINTLNKNTDYAKKAILKLVDILAEADDAASCGCGHALETAVITSPQAIDPEVRQKLDLLVGKYLP